MAWKIRLLGDNQKFIDIMEEGAADSSGAIARVPLRDGYASQAMRYAELIATAPELLIAAMLARDALATAVLANFEGANDDDVSEHIVIKRLDAVITKAGFKT